MAGRKKSKIQGVGINDADYAVNPRINGRRVACKFYQAWKGMIDRCYWKKFQLKHPTYSGCTVCEEWLTFSNFKAWMQTQDWIGKDLDKDLLFVGNKIYSPETCAFIDSTTNSFVIDSGATRGDWPIGACFYKAANNFQSRCSNPFTKKKEFLGYFKCPDQAHKVWKERKHELACQLADLQTDSRVAAALRERYL